MMYRWRDTLDGEREGRSKGDGGGRKQELHCSDSGCSMRCPIWPNHCHCDGSTESDIGFPRLLATCFSFITCIDVGELVLRLYRIFIGMASESNLGRTRAQGSIQKKTYVEASGYVQHGSWCGACCEI